METTGHCCARLLLLLVVVLGVGAELTREPGGRWWPLLVCTGEHGAVRQAGAGLRSGETYLSDMLGSPPSRGG